MKRFWYACMGMLFVTLALAGPSDTPTSLYNLDAPLTNQAGKPHGLDVYRGHPVLVTMFYGSCPVACPLLVDTLRAIEQSTPTTARKDLRVLLISIDPEHDTTAALAKLAEGRRIDGSRWTLANTDAQTVRRIAALLNVQYRALPNGGYNHSSVITLLSKNGELEAQTTVVGRADEAIIEAIGKSARAPIAVSP